MQKLLIDQKHKIASLLETLPFFQDANKAILLKLTYNTKEKSYKQSDILFREGQEVKDVYIIKQGESNIFKCLLRDKIENNIILRNKFINCTAK